jgi:hypothetical protein
LVNITADSVSQYEHSWFFFRDLFQTAVGNALEAVAGPPIDFVAAIDSPNCSIGARSNFFEFSQQLFPPSPAAPENLIAGVDPPDIVAHGNREHVQRAIHPLELVSRPPVTGVNN